MKHDHPSRLFYMALPPNVFTVVATGLKKNCYSEKGNNRIVIEKPFGKDLESSREMIGALKGLWKEEETFRIDHYLGKEMVKNLLIMRFRQPFHRCRPQQQAGRQCADHLQGGLSALRAEEATLTSSASSATSSRTNLSQVLSLLAMERPKSFSAEDIRDEKVKVLKAVPAIEEKDVLIGQYTAGNGKPGYKDDDTVPKDSNCPTFAALALHINNDRWKGVPFILKAGKALDEPRW